MSCLAGSLDVTRRNKLALECSQCVSLKSLQAGLHAKGQNGFVYALEL